MRKTRKRLDRLAFWKRVTFFAVAYVVAIIVTDRVSITFVMLNLVLIIWLALILAWRFRDIGWPVWIGPSLLLGSMLVLGLVLAVYGPQVILAIELIRTTGAYALVIVAGCVPGKPRETEEIAGVFD